MIEKMYTQLLQKVVSSYWFNSFKLGVIFKFTHCNLELGCEKICAIPTDRRRVAYSLLKIDICKVNKFKQLIFLWDLLPLKELTILVNRTEFYQKKLKKFLLTHNDFTAVTLRGVSKSATQYREFLSTRKLLMLQQPQLGPLSHDRVSGRKLVYSRERHQRIIEIAELSVLPCTVGKLTITSSPAAIYPWFILGLGSGAEYIPCSVVFQPTNKTSLNLYFGPCPGLCDKFHHHLPLELAAIPMGVILSWWRERIAEGCANSDNIGITNKYSDNYYVNNKFNTLSNKR